MSAIDDVPLIHTTMAYEPPVYVMRRGAAAGNFGPDQAQSLPERQTGNRTASLRSDSIDEMRANSNESVNLFVPGRLHVVERAPDANASTSTDVETGRRAGTESGESTNAATETRKRVTQKRKTGTQAGVGVGFTANDVARDAQSANTTHKRARPSPSDLEELKQKIIGMRQAGTKPSVIRHTLALEGLAVTLEKIRWILGNARKYQKIDFPIYYKITDEHGNFIQARALSSEPPAQIAGHPQMQHAGITAPLIRSYLSKLRVRGQLAHPGWSKQLAISREVRERIVTLRNESLSHSAIATHADVTSAGLTDLQIATVLKNERRRALNAVKTAVRRRAALA